MQTNTLPTTVSARQIQRDYKSVFSQVKKTNQPVMVISSNEPQVVIMSVDRFNQYIQAESKQNLWEIISSIQAKNKYNDPIATQKDIDEAVEDARQKIYDKYYSSSGQQRSNKRPTITPKYSRNDNQTLGKEKILDSYL